MNITDKELKLANEVVTSSELYRRTPCISWNYLRNDIDLYLKLENMQNTGSFKIRGVINQTRNLDKKDLLVTCSAGNYGKALSTLAKVMNMDCLVVMPETAPQDRIEKIKNLGSAVVLAPTIELQRVVEEYILKEGRKFLHPYDDYNLILGHATCGSEILEACPSVQMILVCCGGGGLLAGIATSIKWYKPDCKVIGVEPKGAPKMFESFQKDHPVTLDSVDTIASGLAPPYAGQITYQICREKVDAICLVNDQQIIDTIKTCYEMGLVVEPSGCASLAALLNNLIPGLPGYKKCDSDTIAFSPRFTRDEINASYQVTQNCSGDIKADTVPKVVAVLTGGNITPNDMLKFITSS